MEINYSIIIPHYNIPLLLKRLLKSIPIREDLQVIVVDDCSTKELPQLESLKVEFPWVEWYDTGENGGGGKARNQGLKYAKGHYVLFADADDFYTPGLSDILDRYQNTCYDMVIFQAISLNSNNYTVDSRAIELDCWIKIYKKNRNRGVQYLKYVFGEPWCRLISLNLIRKNNIRFDEIVCHNDTHFTYMIGYLSKYIEVSSIVGYVVTTRPDSTIHTNFKDRNETVIKVFSEKQHFFDEHGIRIDVSDIYNPLAAALIKFNYSKFKKNYKLIKQYYPKHPRIITISKFVLKLICFKILGEKYPQIIKG